MCKPHIIFVPGKNPKPPLERHRELLWRTLLEGVRRAHPQAAAALAQAASCFQLAAWNALYYGRTKDISRDLPWIENLLRTRGPSEADRRQARAWHRSLNRRLYGLADALPALIRFLPEPMRRSAEETRGYFENLEGIGGEVRERLKALLRPLLARQAPVLLIGHSLGSVIAYDSLWELSRVEGLGGRLDTFLSLGSPLGLRYVQRRLLGADRRGAARYPANIRRWVNVTAVGDLTALDQTVADDFAPMRRLGLIESIEDHCEGVYNFFRNEDGLNCHRSYGYLVNPVVGGIIAEWWRSVSAGARAGADRAQAKP